MNVFFPPASRRCLLCVDYYFCFQGMVAGVVGDPGGSHTSQPPCHCAHRSSACTHSFIPHTISTKKKKKRKKTSEKATKAKKRQRCNRPPTEQQCVNHDRTHLFHHGVLRALECAIAPLFSRTALRMRLLARRLRMTTVSSGMASMCSVHLRRLRNPVQGAQQEWAVAQPLRDF